MAATVLRSPSGSRRKGLRAAAAGLVALLCVAAAASSVAAAEDYEDDPYGDEDLLDEEDYNGEEGTPDDELHVVVLTEDNFYDTIRGVEYALVEFYAPWCGHCKQLAPEYASAAAALAEEGMDNVILAKVDATEEEKLATEFEIQGFPTLKWFVNGEFHSEYGGGRDADSIFEWVAKRLGPPAVTVTAVDEIKDDDGELPEVFALGFFAEFDGDEFNAFEEAATSIEGATIYQTSDATVAKELGVTTEAPAFIVKSSNGVAEYSGEWKSDAITAFFKIERLPTVIPFNEENGDMIFDSGINYQVLLFQTVDSEETYEETFAAAAKAMKGTAIFITVSLEEQVAANVVEFFGLEEDKADGAVMGFSAADDNAIKYKYEGQFTVDDLTTFATDLAKGKLKPFMKSEEPPKANDGPVTVVVGKTFEEICLDSTKDVLLEVYAPWCGHCKQLEPVYKKLGKRFKNIESVVIAKMDGTANEHEMIKTEGFPTILFYPARNRDEPITFEGERTLKGLTKFIKEHAIVPYELEKKEKTEKKDKNDASGHDEL